MPSRQNPARAPVIYAHPEPTSFCAALKDAAIAVLEHAGLTVEVSDLYAGNFDPVGGWRDFVGKADPARFHYQTEQLTAWKNQPFSPDIQRERERCMLEYPGLETAQAFVTYATLRVSGEQRTRFLGEWQERPVDIATDADWEDSLRRPNVACEAMGAPVVGGEWAKMK